jgi:membrane associated rhomboid family serine protease
MVTLILILITAAVSILCFVGVLNINASKFNAYGYSAVGASGAVSAVLFASSS